MVENKPSTSLVVDCGKKIQQGIHPTSIEVIGD